MTNLGAPLILINIAMTSGLGVTIAAESHSPSTFFPTEVVAEILWQWWGPHQSLEAVKTVNSHDNHRSSQVCHDLRS